MVLIWVSNWEFQVENDKEADSSELIETIV